jgi:hypothetical protein
MELDLAGSRFLAGRHRADRRSSIDKLRFVKWYLVLKGMKRIIGPIRRGYFMNVDSLKRAKSLLSAAKKTLERMAGGASLADTVPV